MGFWTLEPFPVQLSSDLSCLACALMLWNPPQIHFPRVSSEMVLVITKTSEGEWNVASSFSLSVWTFLRHFRCISVGASFVLQGFFLRSVLEVRSTKTTLMRFAHLNNSMRWNLSFPNFFTWRQVPFETCTLRFGFKVFVALP